MGRGAVLLPKILVLTAEEHGAQSRLDRRLRAERPPVRRHALDAPAAGAGVARVAAGLGY